MARGERGDPDPRMGDEPARTRVTVGGSGGLAIGDCGWRLGAFGGSGVANPVRNALRQNGTRDGRTPRPSSERTSDAVAIGIGVVSNGTISSATI